MVKQMEQMGTQYFCPGEEPARQGHLLFGQKFCVPIFVKRVSTAGFLLLDAMVALAVLTGGVFLLVAYHRAEVRELRATQETLCATLIAESEIERLITLPYEEMPAGPTQALAFSVPSAARLKGARGTLTVSEVEPGLKEAEVTVFWQPLRGPDRSVSLRRSFAKEGSAP